MMERGVILMPGVVRDVIVPVIRVMSDVFVVALVVPPVPVVVGHALMRLPVLALPHAMAIVVAVTVPARCLGNSRRRSEERRGGVADVDGDARVGGAGGNQSATGNQ